MSSISATQARHALFDLPEVDRFTQAHEVVTDNKDDSGRYASECEALAFSSHTRPFADGLILYNGHAGLGGDAASRCEPIKTPGQIEYPNLTVAPADARATPQAIAN